MKEHEFLIKHNGKHLGSIKAQNYEEALSRIEEIITICEEEE